MPYSSEACRTFARTRPDPIGTTYVRASRMHLRGASEDFLLEAPDAPLAHAFSPSAGRLQQFRVEMLRSASGNGNKRLAVSGSSSVWSAPSGQEAFFGAEAPLCRALLDGTETPEPQSASSQLALAGARQLKATLCRSNFSRLSPLRDAEIHTIRRSRPCLVKLIWNGTSQPFAGMLTGFASLNVS